MLIVCPTCANSYHVAPASLGGAGRKVRCAQCREIWFVNAEVSAVSKVTVATERGPAGLAGQEAVARLERPEIAAEATSVRATDPDFDALYGPSGRNSAVADDVHRVSSKVARNGVVAVGAIALTMAVVGMRETVVRLLPLTAPLYAKIGLPVNLRGLDIRAVTSTLLDDGSDPVLSVEGEISNVRHTPANVPDLRVVLRGLDGREIYAWTASAPKARLASGETVAFRTRLAAPPEGARDVKVRFAAMTEAKTRDGGMRQ